MAAKFPCRNLIHLPHMWPKFDAQLRLVEEEFDILQCEQFCQWCPSHKQRAYSRPGDLRKHARMHHLGKANAHRIRPAKAAPPVSPPVAVQQNSQPSRRRELETEEPADTASEQPHETEAFNSEQEELSPSPEPLLAPPNPTPLDRLSTSAEYAAADLQTLEEQIAGSLLQPHVRMTFEEVVRNIQNIQWQIQRLKSTSSTGAYVANRNRRGSMHGTSLQSGWSRHQSRARGRARDRESIVVEEEGERGETALWGIVNDVIQGGNGSRKRKNGSSSVRNGKRRATDPQNSIRAMGDHWLMGE